MQTCTVASSLNSAQGRGKKLRVSKQLRLLLAQYFPIPDVNDVIPLLEVGVIGVVAHIFELFRGMRVDLRPQLVLGRDLGRDRRNRRGEASIRRIDLLELL